MSRRDAGPSRSARKRESRSVQQLGERLVTLPEENLSTIELPDELAAAVLLARRIKERGGRRRQLHYIGKLMRQLDTSAIATALDTLDAAHRDATDEQHRVERWRDRLIREGVPALSDLRHDMPGVDEEKITALLQQAAAESANHKPPRASRLLFRYLRDVASGTNDAH